MSTENTCESDFKRLSIHDDPIMQQILVDRKIEDSDQDSEEIRLERMYVMLRWSAKYRRIQVSEANSQWSQEDFSTLDEIDLHNQHLNDWAPARKSVTFADNLTTFIPDTVLKKPSLLKRLSRLLRKKAV